MAVTRTRPTRAERLRQNTALGLMLVGTALAISLGGGVAGWLSGHGWHPAVVYPTLRGLGELIRNEPGASLWTVHLSPAPRLLWIGCTGALVVLLLWLVVAPLLRPAEDPRLKGLGQWRRLRGTLSKHAVRRAARWTRPDLDRRGRRRAKLTELGYRVGTLRGTRHQLWADFEKRVRVIARTGWGKTSRLLVEAARNCPGATLIGSTGADLFEQTVRERERRGRVLVVDFSERTHRYAAGFERVRWNPLVGCEDWELATRRGRALVAGAEDGNRGDEQDGFFRDSAGQVIAAWFHAAALARLPISEVVRWQQNIDLPDAKDILRQHPAATKAALLALDKHLDRKADRTTSSVERFVLLAMAPFATPDGEEFATGPSVSIAALIREQATIYLLASDTTAAAVAPLLSLFADEWFHTARAVAISLPARRLPVPAVGILDELRLLTPIASLPQVVYEMRKYGIGVVYALQNAAQETELYHEAAKSLAANVQLTIVGGYDGEIVEELLAQVPEVDVASPSVSGGLLDGPDYSESTSWRKALTAADLQQLADGDALVRLAGVTPFFATFRSFRDDRGLRRAITAEENDVKACVSAAQAVAAAERASTMRTAQAMFERRGL